VVRVALGVCLRLGVCLARVWGVRSCFGWTVAHALGDQTSSLVGEIGLAGVLASPATFEGQRLGS